MSAGEGAELAARVAAAHRLVGGEVGAPLGPRTTYRVGGSAALLVELSAVDQLRSLHAALAATDLPLLVVGKGSNLLVCDAGFPGIAVVLGGEFDEVEIDADGDPPTVRAGGAVSLPALARRVTGAGLTGFEWAVGVPGSVGGAVRMNAGGHGSDMAATLRRVRLFDARLGHDDEVAATDLDLGYRRSAVGADHIVVWAELALAPGDPEAGDRELSEIVRWRRQHQPGGANAGSVFTNPAGDSAGRLIDAAGLKGHRVGTAHVSEKHANFFQADDAGSADDIYRLMLDVRARVARAHGVVLEPETRLVGFPSLPSIPDAAAAGDGGQR